TTRFLIFQVEYVNGSGKKICTNVISKPIEDGGVAAAPPPPEAPVKPNVDPVDPKKIGVKPPELGKDKSTVNLPAAIGDGAVGGAGRYLLFHLPTHRKLAVFDSTEAKIVNYISAADDSVFFAAGAEKLMIVLGNSKVIQRWNLKTFEREVASPVPVNGIVKGIAMGHSSNGPLLMYWAEGSDQIARTHLEFFDIKTMKMLAVDDAA